VCGVGILSAPIAIRTYGWSETGFFCENTASQTVATAKNPVSLVYGWSQTGFLPEKTREGPQQRQKPGFLGLRVPRNTDGQKPGFFARILRQGPQQRQKTRFLGFTGGQKPGFCLRRRVRARSNGNNPVSNVCRFLSNYLIRVTLNENNFTN